MHSRSTAAPAPAKSTALAIARHIVSEARRERVGLRRARPRSLSTAPHDRAIPVATESPMRILVGVDGSASARRALIWAAREARQHHGRLTVCWTGTVPSAPPPGPADGGCAHGARVRIEDELTAAVAETTPDLDPRQQQFVVLGPRLEDVLDLARDADLLVMARPHDRHFAVQPGAAVTRRLTNQSTCPVLLVP